MKKNFILIAVFLAVFGGAAYGENSLNRGSVVEPNSLRVNPGLGLGYATGVRIGGGLEYGIGKFAVARKLPFSYGIAGRLALDLESSAAFSAGAFGTLHFSWSALNLPKGCEWIGNFDTYIGLGVLVLPRVNFDSIGGFSYYFTRTIALNLEAGLSASYIGVLFVL